MDRFKEYETPWEGWNWIYGMYLVDPDGNRYSQEMIRASLFALQYKRALLGTELKIYSLKKELEKRIQVAEPEIIVRWEGQETVIKPSSLLVKK